MSVFISTTVPYRTILKVHVQAARAEVFEYVGVAGTKMVLYVLHRQCHRRRSSTEIISNSLVCSASSTSRRRLSTEIIFHSLMYFASLTLQSGLSTEIIFHSLMYFASLTLQSGLSTEIISDILYQPLQHQCLLQASARKSCNEGSYPSVEMSRAVSWHSLYSKYKRPQGPSEINRGCIKDGMYQSHHHPLENPQCSILSTKELNKAENNNQSNKRRSREACWKDQIA